jgi:hypothetical protein
VGTSALFIDYDYDVAMGPQGPGSRPLAGARPARGRAHARRAGGQRLSVVMGCDWFPRGCGQSVLFMFERFRLQL